MSLFQSEALTLRTYPYSEAHEVVVFLTRKYGKVRAMAYGAKRSARKGFGSALEPLTHLALSFSRKQNQELATVKEFEIIRAFPAYRLSWEVNLHFGYFSELLAEFSQEEEESEKLFRLVLAVLNEIDRVQIGILARYLELWILQLEGVLPALETKVPAKLAAKALAMLRNPPSALSGDCLAAGELKRLERLSEELIEYHLEKRLKTKRLLKQLL
jgi:DNA repair protein RecO (recombination protein O)